MCRQIAVKYRELCYGNFFFFFFRSSECELGYDFLTNYTTNNKNRGNVISCNEAQIFYDFVWHPAIGYTLVQSFLSYIQLQKIQTKLTTLFCMCGYNRNTNYAIFHGQIELQVTYFVPVRASAGSGCILHLLNNWRTPTEDVRKTFRIW